MHDLPNLCPSFRVTASPRRPACANLLSWDSSRCPSAVFPCCVHSKETKASSRLAGRQTSKSRSVPAVSLRFDGLLHSRVGGFIAPRSPTLGFVAFPAATAFSLARARTVNTFPGDAAHTLQSFPLTSSTSHVTTTSCPPVVPSSPKCAPPCRDTASCALHSASPKRSAVLYRVTCAARCQASHASQLPS